jgi:hypothetical protein
MFEGARSANVTTQNSHPTQLNEKPMFRELAPILRSRDLLLASKWWGAK